MQISRYTRFAAAAAAIHLTEPLAMVPSMGLLHRSIEHDLHHRLDGMSFATPVEALSAAAEALDGITLRSVAAKCRVTCEVTDEQEILIRATDETNREIGASEGSVWEITGRPEGLNIDLRALSPLQLARMLGFDVYETLPEMIFVPTIEEVGHDGAPSVFVFAMEAIAHAMGAHEEKGRGLMAMAGLQAAVALCCDAEGVPRYPRDMKALAALVASVDLPAAILATQYTILPGGNVSVIREGLPLKALDALAAQGFAVMEGAAPVFAGIVEGQLASASGLDLLSAVLQ